MPEYDSMEFINAIRGVEGLGGLSGRHLKAVAWLRIQRKNAGRIRGYFLMIPFWELVSMFIVENIAK